jgi:Icc-related predicted phosphoesterase
MNIVILSDTHELENEVLVSAGDFLFHCGDISMFSRRLSAVTDFNEWLGELPHRTKLVVPGNHDHILQSKPGRRSLLSNATLLIDETITVGGLKVFGSPVTPQSGGAFCMPSSTDRAMHWERIPSDVNVLITHGPPYGILDRSPDQAKHMGDPELLARLKDLKSLRLHCFGHVHGAYGRVEQDGVMFVNAALMGLHGDVDRPPAIVRIKRIS